MLFTKLCRMTASRILSPKFNLISIIIRPKSFTQSENVLSNVDWKYRRRILNNIEGCILYDPATKYNPNEEFIRNDETILNLIRFNQSSELNQNNGNAKEKQEKLLSAFDETCSKNSADWKIEQNLFVLDIWDLLRPFRAVFSIVTPSRCLKHLKEIPHGQKLQLLHYLAYSKHRITEAEQWDILYILDQHLDDLSLDEASFFYSALVRCGCETNNQKYSAPIKRCIQHLKQRTLLDENELAVSSAIKAIRILSQDKNVGDLKGLQERLIAWVKLADTYRLTHFAQLGLQQRVFNSDLMGLVIEKSIHFIKTAPNTIRIKDIERVLLAISTFRMIEQNGITNEFCAMVQPFLKNSLNTKFPLDLIQCISSLATIGACDHMLIDWALNYAEHRQISGNEARHILVIDSFAKVNLKGAYTGHILSDQMCAKLDAKLQNGYIGGFHSNLQTEVTNILKMDNNHAAAIKMIPHFHTPNIIFIYNTRTNKTVEILQPIKKYGSTIHANELYDKGSYLVAVVMVTYGRRSTLHSISSGAVIGRLQMQMTQLKMLGFHVVPWNVDFKLWREADSATKRQLLQKRLWIEQIRLFDEKN